jgi:hypothetical protein
MAILMPQPEQLPWARRVRIPMGLCRAIALLPSRLGHWLCPRRPGFTTEHEENHGAPRRCITMTGRADAARPALARQWMGVLFLLETPWFPVCSVVNLEASERARRGHFGSIAFWTQWTPGMTSNNVIVRLRASLLVEIRELAKEEGGR